MPSYPQPVSLAWKVVTQFMEEFTQTPERWVYEEDIQVELSHRLDRLMRWIGIGTVEEWYEHRGKERRVEVPAVGNQPSVWLEAADVRYRPDIVIWKPLSKEDAQKEGMWPLLWACEIKKGSSVATYQEDVKKLMMLRQAGLLDYGCALRVHSSTSCEEASWYWTNSGKGQSIWMAEATAPEFVRSGAE